MFSETELDFFCAQVTNFAPVINTNGTVCNIVFILNMDS